jgi:hypothetical protein
VRIKFVLVCEGGSDRGLVPHLETLCVRAGATEALGDAPDLARLPVPPGKTVAGQVGAVLKLGAEINLLFVHRDSDNRDPRTVRRQITEEVSSLEGCPAHVCVVPVQEIEAWLLTDEAAIRQVSGNPGGREPIGVPARRHIEGTASPKEILKAAIVKASGERGRRLEKIRSQFPQLRAILLQRLDIDGPINELPAWQRLVSDIESTVADIQHPTMERRGRVPPLSAHRPHGRRR